MSKLELSNRYFEYQTHHTLAFRIPFAKNGGFLFVFRLRAGYAIHNVALSNSIIYSYLVKM